MAQGNPRTTIGVSLKIK